MILVPHCIHLLGRLEPANISYKLRHYFSRIQYILMDIRNLSHCDYTLYVDEDSVMLVNKLYNTILWHSNYFITPVSVLIGRLERLLHYWQYESGKVKIKNVCERNDYFTLCKEFKKEKYE